MMDTQNQLNKTFTAFAVWMETNAEKLGITTNPYIGESWGCISFPQTWSSTACGFGGVGGASMTPAQTVVFNRGNWYVVFIAGRFAYTVDRYDHNEKDWSDGGKQFMDELRGYSISGQANATERYGDVAIKPQKAEA